MKPIEIRELSKSFKLKGKPITALDGISFEVATGDSVGFIGQNGAGKSTTIKLLFGAIRSDSGAALLMGRRSSDPRSRKGVGYVPENPYLYELLTPREIISSGLRLHGVRGNENARRTERWLDKLEITYAADKRIRNLSKGMTQRTALAHAFAIEPELLILDEPMSGLDPVGRRQVADLMQEYRQSGRTLFFSSHILHDVERLADRFVMIHKGQIRAQQSISDMLASQGDMIVRYYGLQPMEGFERDARHIWRGCFQRDEIENVLKAVNGASGTLLDIHPQNSLESLFDSITGFKK
ncbi:ABC transporter ATP-binding protein [Pseudomonas knackmussii]|uniref:ABC transporter ATP-binding protein n=1 Tax=Pseudomonas knackmussii TaxID=65741 RepID=A0ABY4KMC0_9PSED|nr:ABC transporter ATP-binding protein [Pseudomonas knackmussii]UPQ81991.1 ABC transporter ATP-binding protein [Pseudomonas knackmussii]